VKLLFFVRELPYVQRIYAPLLDELIDRGHTVHLAFTKKTRWDRIERGLADVMGTEEAAAAEWNSHGLEIARGDHVTEDGEMVAFFELCAILPVRIATQGQQTGESRAGDARHGLHGFQRLREEGSPRAVLVETVTRLVNLHGQQVVGVKTGCHGEQPVEAAQQETGAH
jgi:hypothetical protein